MKHILSTFCLMAAVSAPVAAQEAAQDTAQAAVQDSARIAARNTLPDVPMREIKGRVYDNSTKEPAVGVSISAFNDARYAAMTDEKGDYVIEVPTYVTSLWMRGDGYNSIQVPIGKGDQPVDAYIFSDVFDPVYSAVETATNGRTVGVDYNTNDVSIDPQIQNKLGADVHSITRSGVPGMGVAMYMNGLNSLNANAQPLVVIDGVVTNMRLNAPSTHDGFFNNLFANIMVEDIEKISVLKNGTAIYGAQGANGVILIETKRNKSMATKIDVSIGGSYELLPKSMDIMNSEQYRIYASELIGSTGTRNNNFKFLQTDPNYYYYDIYHNETDWQKQVYDEAFTQNYSINVQGGDDVANYNLSVGYAMADATLKNNSYSRFNLRLNTDIILAKNLSVRFDASYSDVTRDMRDDGAPASLDDGIISSPGFLSLIKSPFLNPYAFDTSGNISSYLAEADDYLNDVLPSNAYRSSLSNPLFILQNGDGDNKNYFGNRLITLAVTPKWNINKYWSIAEHFAFQLVNTDENAYLPVNGTPLFDVEGVADGLENRASSLAARETVLMSHSYFEYARRFKAHWLNVRGGLRYQHTSYSLNQQVGYNSGNDKTPNMSKNLLYKTTDGTEEEVVDMTYYLSADYNWRERYYLSAALSMAGSSKFGVDAADGVKIGNYAWGFFPSVQAAWVVTNESWMPRVSGIDFLRLNVGFDMVGNDDIDALASRTYFVANKMWNMSTGLSMGNIGNTQLQWETTKRFTAGLELSAIHDRLGFSFNYFYGKTSNLLNLSTLSYLSGLETNWKNSGEMENQGFDVTLTGRLIDRKDWKWTVGASAGHYDNEITSLPSGSFVTELYGGNILSQVGTAAGVFYGYKTEGVFSTTEEAEAAALYQTDETGAKTYFRAGDMKFVDVNGDHEINEADMQVIGDPNPELYGNIFTNVRWKNLSLDVVFNYSLGNDVYNYQRRLLESGSRFHNQTTAMLSRWTHEGQQTDIPRISYEDAAGNSRFSDRWIEDGSYLRLKNVTLSYYFPIHNTYIQGLTIWGAANNLLTFTKYLGTDPEFCAGNSVLSMGIDRGLLAQGRNFSLGVKINL